MKKILLSVLLTALPLHAFKNLKQAKDYASQLKKGRKTTFKAEHFKTLLTNVVQYRENIGYAGRFLLKLTPYPDTRFIVWGPLEGAFTSLVRTLSSIHKMGVIDDDFKLRNAATYLVFNGDVINSSETSLETLMLVLSLLHANPKNVFYIKGQSENELHWQNDQLLPLRLPEFDTNRLI